MNQPIRTNLFSLTYRPSVSYHQSITSAKKNATNTQFLHLLARFDISSIAILVRVNDSIDSLRTVQFFVNALNTRSSISDETYTLRC